MGFINISFFLSLPSPPITSLIYPYFTLSSSPSHSLSLPFPPSSSPSHSLSLPLPLPLTPFPSLFPSLSLPFPPSSSPSPFPFSCCPPPSYHSLPLPLPLILSLLLLPLSLSHSPAKFVLMVAHVKLQLACAPVHQSQPTKVQHQRFTMTAPTEYCW